MQCYAMLCNITSAMQYNHMYTYSYTLCRQIKECNSILYSYAILSVKLIVIELHVSNIIEQGKYLYIMVSH